MANGNTQKLKTQVDALQLNIEGLLKLLGSNDPNKRLEFWERLKGITTPAELLLAVNHVTVANSLITQVEANVKSVADAAKQIGGAAKSASH